MAQPLRSEHFGAPANRETTAASVQWFLFFLEVVFYRTRVVPRKALFVVPLSCAVFEQQKRFRAAVFCSSTLSRTSLSLVSLIPGLEPLRTTYVAQSLPTPTLKHTLLFYFLPFLLGWCLGTGSP